MTVRLAHLLLLLAALVQAVPLCACAIEHEFYCADSHRAPEAPGLASAPTCEDCPCKASNADAPHDQHATCSSGSTSEQSPRRSFAPAVCDLVSTFAFADDLNESVAEPVPAADDPPGSSALDTRSLPLLI